MKTNTSQKILEYIKQSRQVSVQDLVRYLGHSPQAIHRQLKKLVQANKLEKIGTPPRVYYQIQTLQNTQTSPLKHNLNLFIEDNFIQILPNGVELKGQEAFVYWCQQRGFDSQKYAKKYAEIYTKYQSYQNSEGLIEATQKLLKTYRNKACLEGLFYLEFSAFEIFGKTKAYTYLLYSKLNENRKMMYQIFEDLQVAQKIERFIQANQIQTVGFIPPTVSRKIQIQKELEKSLALNLPTIEIQKIQTPIIVPQKTLSTTKERILNSQSTFVIPKAQNYGNILLIDDFAGSGATLNFVAEKILNKNKHQDKVKISKIYGLALCGTPNGLLNNSQKFEVVKEV